MFLGYDKIIGFVNLQDEFDINTKQDFEKHFQPIRRDIACSKLQMKISEDQQLVKIHINICKVGI